MEFVIKHLIAWHRYYDHLRQCEYHIMDVTLNVMLTDAQTGRAQGNELLRTLKRASFRLNLQKTY